MASLCRLKFISFVIPWRHIINKYTPSPQDNGEPDIYGEKHWVKWDINGYSIEPTMTWLLQEIISSRLMITVVERRHAQSGTNDGANDGTSTTPPASRRGQAPVHSTAPSNPMGGGHTTSTPQSTHSKGRRGGGRDGDEDLPENKRSKVSQNSSNLRFACPFYKRNPDRYRTKRTCTGPGWYTIPRLK